MGDGLNVFSAFPLGDLERVVLPGVTHWQHPSFFAYYPSNTSGPAILGDLLSSGLGVQAAGHGLSRWLLGLVLLGR